MIDWTQDVGAEFAYVPDAYAPGVLGLGAGLGVTGLGTRLGVPGLGDGPGEADSEEKYHRPPSTAHSTITQNTPSAITAVVFIY